MTATIQEIAVFQQNGSGKEKTEGILRYGNGLFALKTFSIDEDLPPVLDDTLSFLPQDLRADLVIDLLRHPDLSYDLALICRSKKIPMIASGKKIGVEGVFTPPT